MTSTLTGYRVDIARSSAEFAVRNLAVHTVRGRIPIREAVVETDAGGRPVAVRALLDLTGIETGNHRRDRDLAQPRLLDTRRWPTLGFSGPVQVTGAGTWRVPGTLTAHGTATDVVLDVEATEDGDEVRARATTAFDRRALGIRAPRLFVGCQIRVSVEALLSPDLPRSSLPDDRTIPVGDRRGTSSAHGRRPVGS